METELISFDGGKLKKTFDRWKQANFFFDKFKEALTPFEKYNYLSASIVYTRSIFHVLENELNKKQLSPEIKIEIESFLQNPVFKMLNATRNVEIKEKIDPTEMPVWFYPRLISYIGKVKFILQFADGNKVLVKAFNFDTDEPLELESDLVDYNIEITIQVENEKDKTVIQINKLVEQMLDEWLQFIRLLSSKLTN